MVAAEVMMIVFLILISAFFGKIHKAPKQQNEAGILLWNICNSGPGRRDIRLHKEISSRFVGFLLKDFITAEPLSIQSELCTASTLWDYPGFQLSPESSSPWTYTAHVRKNVVPYCLKLVPDLSHTSLTPLPRRARKCRIFGNPRVETEITSQ
jgi:hypothetical protein